MRSLGARPRIAALIIACIGVVLTMVNYRTVMNERNYYPMLMLLGPTCVLYGLAGAVDPRIMSQVGDPAAERATIYRVITVALVLAGLGAGWTMGHFWYKVPGW